VSGSMKQKKHIKSNKKAPVQGLFYLIIDTII
jgi:hypothetical protein